MKPQYVSKQQISCDRRWSKEKGVHGLNNHFVSPLHNALPLDLTSPDHGGIVYFVCLLFVTGSGYFAKY